jgi:hypothetical protein
MQKIIRSQRGLGLVEVVVASAILLTVITMAMTFFANQLKANNFMEFQGRREDLRGKILTQFLNDAVNCKCLFSGLGPMNKTGATTLTAPTTRFGRYEFSVAGDCSTANVPAPFTSAIPSITVTRIRMNVMGVEGLHSGDLVVELQSSKDVLGPKDTALTIPVSVYTSQASPGTVNFEGCTAGIPSVAGGTGGPVGTCPAGQFSTGYDAKGVLQCAPPTYQ